MSNDELNLEELDAVTAGVRYFDGEKTNNFSNNNAKELEKLYKAKRVLEAMKKGDEKLEVLKSNINQDDPEEFSASTGRGR